MILPWSVSNRLTPKSIYDLTEILLKLAVRSKPLNAQPFNFNPTVLINWLMDVAKGNASSHSSLRMGRSNSSTFLQ
jgi:hypothetical protein